MEYIKKIKIIIIKYIPILLITAILFTSCESSKWYLKKGRYDDAIAKSVKKLRRNPTKEKEILILKRAYDIAYEKDNDRIKLLKLEGKPEIWEEVFRIYSKLRSRQTLVKSVLPLKMESGETVKFKLVDYDAELLTAKKKAAEYYYVHGKKLLSKNDKFSARDAYYEFIKVKDFYKSYRDVDDLITKSREMGTSTALIKFVNKSRRVISRKFVDDLLNMGVSNLNQKWVVYDTRKRLKNYDYNVIIRIKDIDVSGNNISEKHFERTKEIKDGYEYVLDGDGNVMKDTLGNDIKKPKIKTIKCKVIKIYQHKSARIIGSVDYFDVNSKQILMSKEVTAENFFDFVSGTALGDTRALAKGDKKDLGRLPAPFPKDDDMIKEAGVVLKRVVYDLMMDNKRFLK